MKKFEVLDRKGNSVFGVLPEGNAYISMYPVYHDKNHTELEVGESVKAEFCIGVGLTINHVRKSKTYTIKRVK